VFFVVCAGGSRVLVCTCRVFIGVRCSVVLCCVMLCCGFSQLFSECSQHASGTKWTAAGSASELRDLHTQLSRGVSGLG
jgi:hypothetical protein